MDGIAMVGEEGEADAFNRNFSSSLSDTSLSFFPPCTYCKLPSCPISFYFRLKKQLKFTQVHK